MYGEMFSANTDIVEKELPVITLKKLKEVVFKLSSTALIYSMLTPGVAI